MDQHLWNTIKAALRGEFKALNTYIRKEAVFQTAKLLLEKTSKKKKRERRCTLPILGMIGHYCRSLY